MVITDAKHSEQREKLFSAVSDLLVVTLQSETLTATLKQSLA